MSRAKAPPAKRSEKGYGDENDSDAVSCFVPRLHSILTIKSGKQGARGLVVRRRNIHNPVTSEAWGQGRVVFEF